MRRPIPDQTVWQSKERLLRVIRASQDGMWDWDLTRNKLNYSSGWFEMLGYQVGELKDSPDLWRRFLHPKDVATVEETFAQALQSHEESYEVEFRLKHKNGRYVPVLSRGFITRDKNGKPIRVSGSNLNLTHTKKKEALLRSAATKLTQSETKFRAFFQQSPIPLCHLEVAQKIESSRLLLVNESFIEFFGYPHSEIRTMGQWLEKAYPDVAYGESIIAAWENDVKEALRNHAPLPGREHRIQCSNGREATVMIGGIFLGSAVLVTFTDLTDRKRIEADLSKREHELRTILDHVPLPIGYALSSCYPQLRFNNAEFVRCFGYTPDEIATVDDWAKLAYPDETYRDSVFDRWNKDVQRAASGDGVIHPRELLIRRKDGQIRDVIISAIFAGDMILTTFVDVTEKKKTEEKLRRARLREKEMKEKQLLTLQKKLQTSMVAASVAHEINQPLSQILLKSQLVLNALPASGAASANTELSELLQGIVEDSQRVRDTIEKMRALLRNVPTLLKPVDLRAVVDGSLLYLQPRIKQLRTSVEVIQQGTLRPIAGDAPQLQLAVSNLIRNALDAVAANDPEHRWIRIELRGSPHKIELVIGDSGGGISPEIRQTIFLLLTSDKPHGTGIGLYLARTAMTNHGGTIRHGVSELGGAEFCLSFPTPRKTRSRRTANRPTP